MDIGYKNGQTEKMTIPGVYFSAFVACEILKAASHLAPPQLWCEAKNTHSLPPD